MNEKKVPSSEELIKFLSLKTTRGLGSFLGLPKGQLEYFLFYAPEEGKYRKFKITKRNGKQRSISAPNKRLKDIQNQLQSLFQLLYSGKPAVHGFMHGKGIISNARSHINKRVLVNIDLSDFFPSIRIERIRAIFLSHPFNFNGDVSNALSKICCHEGRLPQGAPTSPVLSNFACRSLDNAMMKLSKATRVHYTRYADDITFSTNLKELPDRIGKITETSIVLSKELEQIVKANSFEINMDKVRFALKTNRQEVTGIIVNQKLNVHRNFIRNVRAMLNAWEKFGLANAAHIHFEKRSWESENSFNREFQFQRMLTGKISYIGSVRGHGDHLYLKLYERIKKLLPTVMLAVVKKEIEASILPILYTEGKTDIKHIKAAYDRLQNNGLFLDLHLNLYQHRELDKISNGDLLKMCESYAKGEDNQKVVIFLFDRDDLSFLSKVTAMGSVYKSWGNKVFSMVLPVPPHRTFNEICIEHYYTDEEITTEDKYSRRIYLSNEFDAKTGNHYEKPVLTKQLNKLKAKVPQILDNGIVDNMGKNFALSKNAFADYVIHREAPFDGFGIDSFEELFVNLQTLIETESALISVI